MGVIGSMKRLLRELGACTFAVLCLGVAPVAGCSEEAEPKFANPEIPGVMPQDLPAPEGMGQTNPSGTGSPTTVDQQTPSRPETVEPTRPRQRDRGPMVSVADVEVGEYLSRITAAMPEVGALNQPERGIFDGSELGVSPGPQVSVVSARYRSPPTKYTFAPERGEDVGRTREVDFQQTAHFRVILAGLERDRIASEIEVNLKRRGYRLRTTTILGGENDLEGMTRDEAAERIRAIAKSGGSSGSNSGYSMVRFEMDRSRAYLATDGALLIFVTEEIGAESGTPNAYGAQLITLFNERFEASGR